MKEFRFEDLTASGMRSVLGALPEIGVVGALELIPKPPQTIVITGDGGTITLCTQGSPLWGGGRGGADALTRLMSALGWDYTDLQFFYTLEPGTHYRMTGRQFQEIALKLTPRTSART